MDRATWKFLLLTNNHASASDAIRTAIDVFGLNNWTCSGASTLLTGGASSTREMKRVPKDSDEFSSMWGSDVNAATLFPSVSVMVINVAAFTDAAALEDQVKSFVGGLVKDRANRHTFELGFFATRQDGSPMTDVESDDFFDTCIEMSPTLAQISALSIRKPASKNRDWFSELCQRMRVERFGHCDSRHSHFPEITWYGLSNDTVSIKTRMLWNARLQRVHAEIVVNPLY